MGSESSGDCWVCPASLSGILSTSLRRLVHKPEKILEPFVKPGMTVMDLGCGPGFFSIPMAELVGEDGCVIAVDLQQIMLDKMMRAAERQGVSSRIRPHLCASNAIGVTDKVDFALAFYMVHEVPDAGEFLKEIAEILKPGGRLLFVEPKLHVSLAAFTRTVEMASDLGFSLAGEPKIAGSRSALLERG